LAKGFADNPPEVAPPPAASRGGSHWRGQLFLFDRPQPPAFSSAQAYKLMAIFLFFELLVRPFAKYEARSLGIANRDWWMFLQMSLLTALVCGLVLQFAGVPFAHLGLYPWRRWSPAEKHYFPQILVITLLVFAFTQPSALQALWLRSDLWRVALLVLVPQMIWGFYQEFLYRGILQTVLVRCCGAPAGILLGNLIFTFGPLHFYHFALARENPSHLWIFAGIFSIGLYFAILFHRSGNLWMVAILHGLGDFFIDGLAQASRMIR
jgi:membrane protease YdiL (CAAX protease family)